MIENWETNSYHYDSFLLAEFAMKTIAITVYMIVKERSKRGVFVSSGFRPFIL